MYQKMGLDAPGSPMAWWTSKKPTDRVMTKKRYIATAMSDNNPRDGWGNERHAYTFKWCISSVSSFYKIIMQIAKVQKKTMKNTVGSTKLPHHHRHCILVKLFDIILTPNFFQSYIHSFKMYASHISRRNPLVLAKEKVWKLLDVK